MFSWFFPRLQAKNLARQIRQISPDLQQESDETTIDQYLNAYLLNRQVATEHGGVYPISKLYRRVLLFRGDVSKEMLIEEVFRLRQANATLNEALSDSDTQIEALTERDEELLNAASGIIQQFINSEKNQQVNSLPRQN